MSSSSFSESISDSSEPISDSSESNSTTISPRSSVSSRTSSVFSSEPEAPIPAVSTPIAKKEIMMFVLLLFISGIILIFVWINPKKSIVENAKYVYNASIDKMNTTYGKAKEDAEKAAQNAKEKWTSNLQSIYKIVILSIIVFLFLLTVAFNMTFQLPMLFYPLYLLLIGAFLFESNSTILDNALINLFNSIEKDVTSQSLNFGLLGVSLFWIIANCVHGIYLYTQNISLLPVQMTNKFQYFISVAIHVLSAIGVLFSLYFDKKNMTEYKGFVLFLLFILGIVANVMLMILFEKYPGIASAVRNPLSTNTWLPNVVQIIFNVIFVGFLIFELLSNKIDDAIHKNTVDNNIHHKTLSSVVTIGLFFASLVYYIYPKKDDFLGTNINISMIAIFFLLSLFVLFNFPGFDSEYYIFVLFFILNIPMVYLFVTRMLSGSDDKTKLFIPLLIGFYTIFMIIMAMMGTIDMSNHTNIYLLVGLIGFLLLSYTTKFITDPKYKTFFMLFALIILSITTLYYSLTSRIWYVYLILFISALIYFDIIHIPYKPEKPSPPSIKISPLEKKMLAGEITFILLFLYIRSLLKSIYTKNGESIVNSPVPLNKHTNVKVSKKFKYTYGVSFWVKLDPMPPGSIPQANEYVPILSYGNTPTVSYCGSLNTLRVEMQNKSKKMRIIDTIRDIPLQKWNHIAINYADGTCDVFINGELHNTKTNIIPYNDSSELIIGSIYNVRGEICNTTIFNESFTRAKIQQLYTQFKDKTPPIF
jgi:hypothetical protein